MRVVATIRVAYEADSYKSAGAVLDEIMAPAEHLRQYKGHADVVAFETRPCKDAQFDQMERDMESPPAEAMAVPRY